MSFIPKTGMLKTQNKLMFRFRSEDREKKPMSQLKAVRQKEFPLTLTPGKASLFLLLRPLTDWLKTITWGGKSA